MTTTDFSRRLARRQRTVGPQDTSITEAIVVMGRALSLPVICEGVETEVQLAELRRMGCDQVQGYYFSRPVDAQKMTTMLLQGAPGAKPELGAASSGRVGAEGRSP